MSMQMGMLPCGKCGGLVEVQLQSKPSIINRETISMLLVEHSGIVTCPSCLTKMLPVMVNVAGVVIALTEAVEEQHIITPGSILQN